TSIQNSIENIKKKLVTNTNIEIISDNKGTKIKGNEISIREAMIWFNQYVFTRYVVSDNTDTNNQRKILEYFYSKKIVDVAYNILFEFAKKNNTLISDYYIFNTLNIYIVQLHRLTNSKKIRNDIFLGTDKMSNVETYTLGANELLDRAASRLLFSFSKAEIKFLSKYLILNRFEAMPIEESFEQLIRELINSLSEILKIDFSNDRQLKKELMQHVPPMIYRLKYKIK